VRAVLSVPYQNILPDEIEIVSQKWIPWIASDDENGPNTIDAVLLAEPAGEAAAPNNPLWRA
jgi:hypothetical protein